MLVVGILLKPVAVYIVIDWFGCGVSHTFSLNVSSVALQVAVSVF